MNLKHLQIARCSKKSWLKIARRRVWNRQRKATNTAGVKTRASQGRTEKQVTRRCSGKIKWAKFWID